MKSEDINFMREALLEAEKAFASSEVPVGAVLVLDGKVVARAHNQVEEMQDASCHAEILCMQEGAKVLGSWRLLECTLYCTLEPCSMCAGAMALFRVKRLVYGAPDLRHGADGSLFNFFAQKHPIHQVEVERGVCAEESRRLMQEFFRKRREHAGRII